MSRLGPAAGRVPGRVGTVTADTIRDLAEPPAPRPRRAGRWRRWLHPLAAAAAVMVIAMLAAVLPKASGGNQDKHGPVGTRPSRSS